MGYILVRFSRKANVEGSFQERRVILGIKKRDGCQINGRGHEEGK